MKPVYIPEHLKTDPTKLDEFTKRNWDRVSARVASWSSGLTTLEKHANRKIDEPSFRRFFLPLMLGTLNDKDFKDAYLAWMSIAGNEWSEVDITDAGGKVVAVVPAFNDLGRFSPLTSGEKALPARIDLSFRLGQINPNMGRASFADAMTEAFKDMHDKQAFNIAEEKWAAFFRYFGHDFKSGVGVETSQPKALSKPAGRGGPQDTDIEVDW